MLYCGNNFFVETVKSWATFSCSYVWRRTPVVPSHGTTVTGKPSELRGSPVRDKTTILGNGLFRSQHSYFARPTAPISVQYRTDPGQPPPLPRSQSAPGRQGLSLIRAVGRTRDGVLAGLRGWFMSVSPRRLGIWTKAPPTIVWRRRQEVGAASRTPARCPPATGLKIGLVDLSGSFPLTQQRMWKNCKYYLSNINSSILFCQKVINNKCKSSAVVEGLRDTLSGYHNCWMLILHLQPMW